MIRGDLGKPARHRQSRPAPGQTHREEDCRHRHHQPARNHPALGSPKPGRPIHHAIVWQDRHAQPRTATASRRGHAAAIRRKTGLVIDAYFSATKIAWLLKHVKGARALAQQGRLAFGTIDTWLIWKLTGGTVHVTDASNASRTMLYNLRTGDWDAELLKLFKVPRSVLPEVRGSSGSLGRNQSARRQNTHCRHCGRQQAPYSANAAHAPAW